MFLKKFSFLIFITAFLTSFLLVTPIQAKNANRITPDVKIKISRNIVEAHAPFKIRGRVSGKSVGVEVKLQELIDNKWRVVDKSYVRNNRTYIFYLYAGEQDSTYRVKTARNQFLKRAKSSSVSIIVEDISTPPEEPDPVDPEPEEPDPVDPDPEEPQPEEPQPPVLADYSLDELRYELIMDINEYREARGKAPVNMLSSLNSYALAWSDSQADKQQVSKRTQFPNEPSKIDIKDEFVTINGMPEDVMDFFAYQSPEILLGNYKWIGIGMTLYSENTGYWTLDFAIDEATPPPPPPPHVWTETEVRNLILKETNEYRAQNGKPALKLMPQLNTVAQNWSRHMADNNDFRHNPSFSQQYPAGWTRAGENIAAGHQVEAVVQAWINSSGHRANLLGDYTHLGVGYATNNNSTYKRYYVQNFGKY